LRDLLGKQPRGRRPRTPTGQTVSRQHRPLTKPACRRSGRQHQQPPSTPRGASGPGMLSDAGGGLRGRCLLDHGSGKPLTPLPRFPIPPPGPGGRGPAAPGCGADAAGP